MKDFLNAIIIGLVLMIPSSSTNAYWCESKAELSVTLYQERNEVTEGEQIAALVDAWSNSRRAGEEVVGWYKIVDVQRMIRDVYREGRKGEFRLHFDDTEKLYDRELYMCMTSGY